MGYRLYGEASPRWQIIGAIIVLGSGLLFVTIALCLASLGVIVPRWVISILGFAFFVALIVFTRIARKTVKRPSGN